MKGRVLLQISDAETGELKRSYEENNVILAYMEVNDIFRPDINTTQWIDSSTSRAVPGKIHASQRQIAPGNKVLGFGGSHITYPSNTAPYPDNYDLILPDQRVSTWEYFDGNPPYLETTYRFSAPTETKTINSIYTTPYNGLPTNLDNNINFIATAISLNTPCIQEPGEVLDITYRIQFFDQVVNSDNVFIGDDFFKNSYIANRIDSDRFSAFPSYAQPFHTKSPINTPDNDLSKIVIGNNSSKTNSLFGTGTTEPLTNKVGHFKSEFNIVLEKNDLIGNIIRGVSYGSDYVTTFFNNNNISRTDGAPETYASAQLMTDFVDNDFAFKPIQPIQNHSKDAIEWGLDVDYLASGQGSISVDGSNWTNPDWSEFWRVEISKTGDVGDSNYFFRNKRFIGFVNNSYEPHSARMIADHTSQQRPGRHTANNPHGLHELKLNEEYGPDSYVSWDQTGINIHFVNDTKIISYGNESTPTIPATNITQIAVMDNGDIWMSCRNTGLYRLTDPTNKASATVTKMTEVDNSLFSASGNRCYAVAPGTGDSLWAVFEGALSYTTNPYDTVPVFVNYEPLSTTAFDYTGLTDGNWNLVKYMRVDRNTPDQEMAIMYNDNNTEQIVWWSLAGVSYEGPQSSNYVNSTYDWQDGNQWGSVDVSQRGNLWGRHGPNFDDELQKLQWSSDVAVDVGFRSAGGFAKMSFMYDYYDTPYFFSETTYYVAGTSTSNKVGHSMISSTKRVHYTPHPRITSQTLGLVWQDPRASGMFQSGSNSYSTVGYKSGSDPKSLHAMGQGADDALEYLDSLDGQHSPVQEVIWDKFHWNGTAWEKNYFVDAVDSTGNYSAKRHNFDTESHFFTGRSMIDVTDVFTTGNFGTSANATFAFNLQPEQKEDSTQNGGTYHFLRVKKQEADTTLLEISDKQNRLQIRWRNRSSDELLILENDTSHVIANTPVNITSGFYRLVVTVSGTLLKVYLDGVQIGSSVTLQNSYDWSNTSSDLYAFVSSRVYDWSDMWKHSLNQGEHFRGFMENIQFWNVAWDDTDIANDFADITGVITSKPATNLLAHYELTESLEGLETRPTHITSEEMDEGIEISFSNGANPTAFVATDYYTFGVVDGILKDNSLSMSRRSSIYHKPVDYQFSEFTNTQGMATIPGSVTDQITEKALFTNGDGSIIRDTYSATTGPSFSEYNVMDWFPGKVYYNRSNAVQSNWDRFSGGAKISQYITADGYIEGKAIATDNHVLFGFTDVPNENFYFNTTITGSAGQQTMRFAIELLPNGNVSIRESGNVVAVDIASYTLTDTFKVARVGTVITYHIIDSSGNDTVIYTSAVASTGTIHGAAVMPYAGTGMIDVVVNYTSYDNTMRVGNEVTLTGWYNNNWYRLEGDDVAAQSIQIDGVDATVTMIDYDLLINTPNPAPLEVIIDSRTGYMFFHSDDIGKVVTGRVTVIYDQ